MLKIKPKENNTNKNYEGDGFCFVTHFTIIFRNVRVSVTNFPSYFENECFSKIKLLWSCL